MLVQITDDSSIFAFRHWLDSAEVKLQTTILRMWRRIERDLPDEYDELTWLQVIRAGHDKWATENLEPALDAAMIEAHRYIAKHVFGQKGIIDAWQFEGGGYALEQYIKERSFDTIASLNATQVKTLRRELYYWSVLRNKPVNVIASNLAKVVGLLPAQQNALKNLRENLRAQGVSERLVKNAAERYRYHAKKSRALMLARTELAYAYQKGKDESIRAAVNQSLLYGVRKTWHVLDEFACDICGPNDKQTVHLNEEFKSGHARPPAHPRCRCDVSYSQTI